MHGVQVAHAWLGPLRVPPECSSSGWIATTLIVESARRTSCGLAKGVRKHGSDNRLVEIELTRDARQGYQKKKRMDQKVSTTCRSYCVAAPP